MDGLEVLLPTQKISGHLGPKLVGFFDGFFVQFFVFIEGTQMGLGRVLCGGGC